MKSFVAVLVLCAAVFASASKLNHEPLSQELVDFVNAQQTTWTAGHNDRLRDVPLSTVKKMLGVLSGHKDHMPQLVMKHPARLLKDVPDTFDAREKWPKCKSIGEIRDQGACGSCWALGAVEAQTDRHCIASDGAKTPHISAEDLNSCCDSCGDGCDGGYPGEAWNFWSSTGLVTGGNYNTSQGCQPYTIAICDHHTTGPHQPCGQVEDTPSCKKTCEANYNVEYSKDKHIGKTAYSVDSDPANIQAEIMKNGPVEAAFDVYADFLSYKTGVYKHTTGDRLGGHAVKVLGWGVEKDTPYWLVANSWNEDWGEKGYFRIIRGNDDCGIESAMVAGLAPTN